MFGSTAVDNYLLDIFRFSPIVGRLPNSVVSSEGRLLSTCFELELSMVDGTETIEDGVRANR